MYFFKNFMPSSCNHNCRKSAFRKKSVLQSFLLSYFFAFGGTLAWLFAFDREILSLSLLILIFSTILLYIALGISYKRVYDNLKQLNTEKNRGQYF